MDLSTSRRERRLKHDYVGEGMSAAHLRYKPIKIIQFEICRSWLNDNKDCLVAQAMFVDKETGEVKKVTIWTESYSLIKTIRGTEDSLQHYTKIIRKRDGYYYFVKLNDIEKSTLLNI